MVQIITKVSEIVGGLGTMAAVIWAVYEFAKNRQNAEAGQFRQDIIEIMNRFEEMMVVFQDNIIFSTKTLLDSGSTETRRLYKKILAILDEADEASAKAKTAAMSQDLSDWVLYSFDPKDLSRNEQPRVRCFSTLQSIRGFLPVMYEFIDNVGGVILGIYKNELSINTLREYVKDSVPTLWKIKRDKAATITNDDELQSVWRSVIAAKMSRLSANVSIIDAFNDARRIVTLFTEIYLKNDNRKLWKDHMQETKVDTKIFDAQTHTETLTKIVKWKIGKSDPDLLTQLVRAITDFENKLGR